ncbi:MAG TPA: hypothetical protein VMS76_19675 [Planctomycetota bacterium]|nr:hypothetical protein [Planctomycetota bacterium]
MTLILGLNLADSNRHSIASAAHPLPQIGYLEKFHSVGLRGYASSLSEAGLRDEHRLVCLRSALE